jgi:hypothetical protein
VSTYEAMRQARGDAYKVGEVTRARSQFWRIIASLASKK